MTMQDLPAPEDGFVVTHKLTVADVPTSRDFYANVLGGTIVMQGPPAIVKLANAWVTINVAREPTPDKPTVTLTTLDDPDRQSSFMNIRVADIQARYEEWSAKGANFITPPLPNGNGFETRCYIRDPDGYIIEVGHIDPAALRKRAAGR